MISVDNISIQFGGFVLLDDVSLMVNSRDHIGLVGHNGAGKTTLLKIIHGDIEPTSGKVVRTTDASIGYLPQQMKHKDGKTVFNEAMTAFQSILEMEKKIEEINLALAQRNDFESPEYLNLIDKLTQLNEQYDLCGGQSIHADVEKNLTGLGFEREDLHRPTSEFSGGWRMRIELAKILLRKPDFLLLDEPTNHLDIESIQWLEDFLSVYTGGVVLISHDRAFLDKVTNRTVEVSLGRLIDYKVPYSTYVKLREERRGQELAAYLNQQKKIKDTEEFIERFRYKATKAVQVQSRIKHLNKLQRIEVEEENNSTLNIQFPPSERSGKHVVEANALSKSYGSNLVLDHIDLLIGRGEKVAFVGRNGEGKTTLSKIIVGETDHSGSLKLGHNVSIGYFAQNQDELLREDLTVFETVDNIAKGEMRTKVRDILGAFLFSGEEVDKKVKILSGGEKSRLAMACLLMESHNLLVMDEPTNHLDMRSKDILKSALNEYDGTLILVSHDRDFLNGLVEKVFEFRAHKIKEHIGGIYDFLENRKLESLQQLERKEKSSKKDQEDTISDNKMSFKRRKEYDRKIRKAHTMLEKVEYEIEKLEEEMAQFDSLMKNPDNIKDQKVFEEYERLRRKLDHKMKEWETRHLDLENLKERRF